MDREDAIEAMVSLEAETAAAMAASTDGEVGTVYVVFIDKVI